MALEIGIVRSILNISSSNMCKWGGSGPSHYSALHPFQMFHSNWTKVEKVESNQTNLSPDILWLGWSLGTQMPHCFLPLYVNIIFIHEVSCLYTYICNNAKYTHCALLLFVCSCHWLISFLQTNSPIIIMMLFMCVDCCYYTTTGSDICINYCFLKSTHTLYSACPVKCSIDTKQNLCTEW